MLQGKWAHYVQYFYLSLVLSSSLVDLCHRETWNYMLRHPVTAKGMYTSINFFGTSVDNKLGGRDGANSFVSLTFSNLQCDVASGDGSDK